MLIPCLECALDNSSILVVLESRIDQKIYSDASNGLCEYKQVLMLSPYTNLNLYKGVMNEFKSVSES